MIRRGRKLAALLATTLVVCGLAWCYYRISWTVPPNSDGPANALQAQDMLHGNWLLQGWTLTDVSFYTTELPEYAGIELVRSVGMGVVHTAAALTYTLLVVLAALLARGSARGGEGLARALTAAGIMLAPQLGSGAFVLLLSPDHVGTQVPLMFGWLVLDRAPRRWYVAGFIGLLLAWVQVADRIALLAAVLPLAIVCLVRVAAAGWHRAAAWFELSLAAAAIASVFLARVVSRLIIAHGYTLYPVPAKAAPLSLLPVHLRLTGRGIAQLFGADFAGISGGPAIFFAAVHCGGLALVALAFVLAVARPDRLDLVGQVLVAGIVSTLAAYAFSNTPGIVFGTGYAAREMAAVLPLGAALAGRIAGPWFCGRARMLAGAARWRGRVPVLAGGAVLVGCLAALLYSAAQPAAASTQADLVRWLLAHDLTTGLATRNSQLMTVDSGERLHMLVSYSPWQRVHGVLYQSKAADYDPRTHDATFVVAEIPAGATPISSDEISVAETIATFGRPASMFVYEGYTILVYRKNLLTLMPPPQPRFTMGNPAACKFISILTCLPLPHRWQAATAAAAGPHRRWRLRQRPGQWPGRPGPVRPDSAGPPR